MSGGPDEPQGRNLCVSLHRGSFLVSPPWLQAERCAGVGLSLWAPKCGFQACIGYLLLELNMVSFTVQTQHGEGLSNEWGRAPSDLNASAGH